MTTHLRDRFVVNAISDVVTFILGATAARAESSSADFSKRRLISNMHVTLRGCDFNPVYGGGLRMLHPNTSNLKAQFYVRGWPRRGFLILNHRSSIDVGAVRGGTSPITIEVNGVKVVRNYSPDHGYNRERFSVGRYLKHGWNTITISYGNGSTGYCLRTMRVETE